MEGVASPYRPSKGRLAFMVILAFVAVVAFVILADVRLNEGDPILEGVSDAGTRDNMTTALLVVEAFAFLGVLLLLLLRPNPTRVDSDVWTSTGGTTVGDGSLIQIGCPGCGTVFEKVYTDVDEPHEQNFRCPNCGRQGRLKMALHKPVSLRATVCTNCEFEFTAYRDGAECPRCHSPSALS